MKIISYIIVISILFNLLVQFGIILKYFLPFLLCFLSNKKQPWNSNHDRLFSTFFLVFFGLSMFLSRSLLNTSQSIYFAVLTSVTLIGITASIYLLYRKSISIGSDSKNFSRNNEETKSNYDFVNNYKKSELEKIFENLIDENLISIIKEDENILDKDLFVEIISNEKLPESPIFKINMDNIQTQLFHSLFSEKTEKLTLEKFLKIFDNKNKKGDAPSIRSSASNAKNRPKKADVIKSLFKG
jgi:hypothetical protein